MHGVLTANVKAMGISVILNVLIQIMPDSADPLDRLNSTKCLLIGLLVAFVFELLTVIFRFGFGFQSTRDTAWLATMTLGARIHHGYVGLIMIALAVTFLKEGNGYRNLLLILGFGLALSDLMHHFAVLWPLTGDPQFDLWYY